MSISFEIVVRQMAKRKRVIKMTMEFITKNTARPQYIMYPRFLFEVEVSDTAKLLYSLLYERTRLSMKNDGWMNERGYVFCIYTIKELAGELHKSTGTVKNSLADLERLGLIYRERKGYNRPNRIYLKMPAEVEAEALTGSQSDKSPPTGETEICPSGGTENYPMDGQNFIPHMDRKLSPNKKEKNNNYRAINTSINLSGSDDDGMDEYMYYREYFLEQLEFEVLLHDCPYEQDMLNEILDLLVDTVCSKRSTIRISREDKPTQVVKSQLMKLNGEHVKYVLSCLESNTTKVRNIKQYLLTALYNAPMTINSHYSALVNYDMYGGGG